MRKTIALLVALTAVLTAFSSGAEEEKASKEPPKLSEQGRISYSLGYQIGTGLKRSGVELDYEAFVRALRDVLEDRQLAMTEEEIQECMQEFSRTAMARQQEMRAKETADNAAEEKAFIEENAKKEGVVSLDSGLQYKVITEGTGPSPKPSDRVKVVYTGKFVDGKVFDSTAKHGKEYSEFGVNQVIKGWSEALQLMKVGGKWEVYVPAELGYGVQGRPNIGPNKMLIFEVELLEIVPTVVSAPVETLGDGSS